MLSNCFNYSIWIYLNVTINDAVHLIDIQEASLSVNHSLLSIVLTIYCMGTSGVGSMPPDEQDWDSQ